MSTINKLISFRITEGLRNWKNLATLKEAVAVRIKIRGMVESLYKELLDSRSLLLGDSNLDLGGNQVLVSQRSHIENQTLFL